jgi:hypothetical protein
MRRVLREKKQDQARKRNKHSRALKWNSMILEKIKETPLSQVAKIINPLQLLSLLLLYKIRRSTTIVHNE